MKTSLMVLASLLFLLLATRTHGIRLDRQLHEAINSKQDLGDSKAGQPSNVADSINKHCTSYGRCTGKAKKPLVHAESGAAKHQSPKGNDDTTVDEATPPHEAAVTSHGSQEAKAAAAVVRGAAPRDTARQPKTAYPDILDIAGMDYSPAARKPPIHN